MRKTLHFHLFLLQKKTSTKTKYMVLLPLNAHYITLILLTNRIGHRASSCFFFFLELADLHSSFSIDLKNIGKPHVFGLNILCNQIEGFVGHISSFVCLQYKNTNTHTHMPFSFIFLLIVEFRHIDTQFV